MKPEDIAARVLESHGTLLGNLGAFLPERVPLDRLPGPFQKYLHACEFLADHYPASKGGVRLWLGEQFARPDAAAEDALSQLSEHEAWSLLTAFAALGHTYRWDTVPPAPDRLREATIVLPEGLDRLWTNLAERVNQPRVGTMWSLHLCNWRFRDRPGGAAYLLPDLTIENLQVAHQWLEPPAGAHLERFSLSFVLMEAAAAGAVKSLLKAILAAARSDVQETAHQLMMLAAAIDEISKSFATHIRDLFVDPNTWLELVQPTFAWAATDGDGRPLPGPNGMQLPSLQCLDSGLGIGSKSRLARQALDSRAFMPARHRAFLSIMDEASGIICGFTAKANSLRLRHYYNDCVRALWKFRTIHRVRGARYLEAGRHGSSGRVSTGLGLAWRPKEGTAVCPHSDKPDSIAVAAEEPIADFKQRMNERLAELSAAMFPSDEPFDEPTLENVFRFLSVEERSCLFAEAPLRHFKKGEVIVQQGSDGHAIHLVEEGFVRVEKASSSGKIMLARLWPGELFGEISFLCEVAATASVVADEDVEVRILDRAYVYVAIAQSATLGMRFYKSLAVQLASRLSATNALLGEFGSSRVVVDE